MLTLYGVYEKWMIYFKQSNRRILSIAHAQRQTKYMVLTFSTTIVAYLSWMSFVGVLDVWCICNMLKFRVCSAALLAIFRPVVSFLFSYSTTEEERHTHTHTKETVWWWCHIHYLYFAQWQIYNYVCEFAARAHTLVSEVKEHGWCWEIHCDNKHYTCAQLLL